MQNDMLKLRSTSNTARTIKNEQENRNEVLRGTSAKRHISVCVVETLARHDKKDTKRHHQHEERCGQEY